MKKIYKILTIIGTRPEIIKLSVVLKKFDKYFNHSIIHTGQNYDYNLNEVFFKDLNIKKPKYFLNCAGETSIQTISNVISRTEKILKKEKPDGIVVYGDTNSCLSVITAKRLKIPTFHFEAGNRSFDQNVPEELNRKIVDHMSDINFVLTEHARRYLLDEGIRGDAIFKTGSFLPEIFENFRTHFSKSNILKRLKLKQKGYLIYSFHREENIDSLINLKKISESINYLAKEKNIKILVSTHPRTKKQLKKLKEFRFNKLVNFHKPFGFFDYIQLQKNAYCTISDSGTITEESSLLNFPAITIRNSHERPEGMDEGVVIMSGLDKYKILSAIEITVNANKNRSEKFEILDYKNKHVSDQVSKIIFSYIEFINKNVWKKNNSINRL
jgi:UDP-N-acetylglucosamine 2-epimerase (non-hydrolysing)